MMIPLGLSLLFLYAIFGVQGRDRGPTVSKLRWIGVFLCLFIAYRQPHPGLSILVALVALNLWRFPMVSEKVHTAIYPVCAYGGAFALLGQQMAPDMVAPILWGMVVVGCGLGLWAAYALIYFGDCAGFMHHYRIGTRYLFSLYEPRRDHGFECAQGNPNHAQAGASVCTAAGAGLIWMGHWQAWIVLPLLLLPIIGIQLKSRSRHPTQGIFYLMNLGLGIVSLFTGLLGWLWGAYGMALVLIAQPWRHRDKKWWDSGRLKHWKNIWLSYWWEQPWLVKLMGCGTSSWIAVIYKHAEIHFKMTKEKQLLMTSAHNEYLHVWIEHGLLGLVALLWYVADVLQRAFHAGLEGQAVFLMGIVIASIALISFPWTQYHEVFIEETKTARGHGCPGLNAASFIVALLIEAVR